MSKLLDLRPILQETFDIVLSETETLRLRKPSETMLLRLSEQMAELSTSDAPDDAMRSQLDALNALVLDVLSNNVDGKRIEPEFVEDQLPLAAKLAILQGYAEFAVSLVNDPN